MKKLKRPVIIVVTGAESTGKSELTRILGHHFSSPWYPEYAREYLEKSGRPYDLSDVEAIARMQMVQMKEAILSDASFVFFDTWLIITKVWMEVVFGTAPGWIHEALLKSPVDFFLLCDTDIPWQPDPFRENGGEMREKLSEIYLQTLQYYGFRHRRVTGRGDERVMHALEIIREME